MILTPIPPALLPEALGAVAGALTGPARVGFERIAATQSERASAARLEAHRQQALALAQTFGMGAIPGEPADGFHWDGAALRAESEPYVVLHEIAHFQIATPARRRVVEFGLGPGPDTGRRGEAKAAQTVDGLALEAEEAAASLLGILWEAALGHPALASFLDQNWLEGWKRGAAAAHFDAVFDRLLAGGLVTADARPTRLLAEAPARRSKMDMDSETALEGGGLAPPAPSPEPA